MKISNHQRALIFRTSLPKAQGRAKTEHLLDGMWLVCKNNIFVCCSRGLSLVLPVDYRSVFLFCLFVK